MDAFWDGVKTTCAMYQDKQDQHSKSAVESFQVRTCTTYVEQLLMPVAVSFEQKAMATRLSFPDSKYRRHMTSTAIHSVVGSYIHM
jgi:hypothetical protein